VDVQIFGTRSCADTRKALRFFKERRVPVHFADLTQRPASKGELRRFVQKFGADAVVDRDAKRFRALGLDRAHYGPDRWLDILADEPLVLRTPLVRRGKDLSVGLAEDLWREWTGGSRGG
jgi:arsenate reductase-like glutaredoxin family protein